MVTVANYRVTENKQGRKFIALDLQGDPEFVKSKDTGRFYLTAKRCSITSTFSEEAAKVLVGTKFPGSIAKVETEAYDYTVPETGEVISLTHSYQYMPEENTSQVHSLDSQLLKVA